MCSKLELLKLLKKQEEVIIKQSKTIEKLVNENAEQENMINALMQEKAYDV